MITWFVLGAIFGAGLLAIAVILSITYDADYDAVNLYLICEESEENKDEDTEKSVHDG